MAIFNSSFRLIVYYNTAAERMGLSGVRHALCLLLPALLSWGCTNRTAHDMRLQVEIDIYSGRPNPAFELAGPEAAEIQTLLSNLPRAQAPPSEPGLGYRGFVVSGESALAPGLSSPVRVFAGHIIPAHGSELYEDVHGVEAWLKRKARIYGYAAFFP